MTSDWARTPYDVLEKISVRIVNEVEHVNRVLDGITSKPPTTIELVPDEPASAGGKEHERIESKNNGKRN